MVTRMFPGEESLLMLLVQYLPAISGQSCFICPCILARDISVRKQEYQVIEQLLFIMLAFRRLKNTLRLRRLVAAKECVGIPFRTNSPRTCQPLLATPLDKHDDKLPLAASSTDGVQNKTVREEEPWYPGFNGENSSELHGSICVTFGFPQRRSAENWDSRS